MILNIIRSETEPFAKWNVLWVVPNIAQGTQKYYIWGIGGWNEVGSGGSGGGLTPEQEAKLNAITITGSGNTFLAGDGTYKEILTFDNFKIVADETDLPQPGDNNVLYLTANDGTLYWYDGTNYKVVDQGLFNNYLPITGGTISGNLSITGNLNGSPLSDYLKYTYSTNIPVLLLQPGTKVTSASLADATVHEILGVNTYTTPKTFDQTEVGSPEALFNINVVYDDELTKGHATADVYNEDGSYRAKEVFAYASDLVPKFARGNGVSSVVVEENAVIQYVNYNRLFLFSTDYGYSGDTVTITNTDIIDNLQPTDIIEVAYYI